MRKNKQRPPNIHRPGDVSLDSFTEAQLDDWARGGDLLQWLADKVYFELEALRAAKYDALCDALRSSPGVSIDVNGWSRVTDWRWCLSPLSPAGSIKGIGGRFNIGETLDRARGQAFPCLYIAQSIETAYAEYFGESLSTQMGPLTLGEFALRRSSSFTTFLLNGRVERVLDLRDDTSLKSFADIIRRFSISSLTKAAFRSAGLPQREIIRSPKQLRRRLLMEPKSWRQEPTVFGIPVASQIFGRFVRDADWEAILYPSQRGNDLCLGVFPENFQASDSRIEVVGAIPSGASHIVLDKEHLR
jgi:RES domain